MHRVTGATWRAVGIALVVLLLVVSIAAVGLTTAVHSPSASAARAPSGAVKSSGITADRSYQTSVSVIWNGTTILGGITTTPQNLSFYVNTTWGTITNTNTRVWVGVQDLITGDYLANITLNGTINPANVLIQNNNGVTIQNYTFATSLSESTLSCSSASCQNKIPTTDDEFAITANVWEYGASAGGNTVFGSSTQYTTLVSTYTSAVFSSPAPYSFNSVPIWMSFTATTTWAYVSNASTHGWVTLFGFYSGLPLYTFSLNGTVNSTNSAGTIGSVLVSNSTVNTVPTTVLSWSILLNQTTLGCAYPSCNDTFQAQYDGLQGEPFEAVAYFNQTNGSFAGGSPVATGSQIGGENAFTLGSTVINLGIFDPSPAEVQGLPYTQTGWINATWVKPTVTAANTTFTGFFQLWDTATDTLVATISMNNSVNTVTAGGVSLMPSVYGNGTTSMGIPYVNLTWSITLSATAASLGTTVPYDPFSLDANVTANGTGQGGVYQWWYETDLWGFTPTLAQYPTTVGVALSPAVPAYVPIGLVQNFSIAVANAPITAGNTVITVSIVDETLSVLLGGLGLGPIYVSQTTMSAVANTTNYQFAINSVAMTCSTPVCTFVSSIGFAPGPSDVYAINVTVSVNGVGQPTNGTYAVGSAQSSFYAVFAPVSAVLSSPNPTPGITPGNVTVSVTYSGSFISSVTLNVYSPTGALVFAQAFGSSGANATWLVTSPGTYKASILVVTAYANPATGSTAWYFNATLTVNTVPRIYVNSTQYSNSTLIPGLSAAESGTLLLILGLIIGMIVAFLLGRAVWGGKKEQTPPQQWEGTAAAGAAGGAAGATAAGQQPPGPGSNTCSVCGRSFSSAEDLAAHQKSEHGMG